MFYAAIFVGCIIAVITVIWPRVGAYLFWFITLLYPSSLLYAVLPFHVRFDDLFLVWTVLACMRMAPPDVLTSRSFRISFLWFLTILLGNMVGMLTGPAYIRWAVFKSLGKALYIPMLAFIIGSVTRDERDARRMLWAIVLASIGTFVIGIVQVHAPYLTAMWETPSDDLAKLTVSEIGEKVSDEARRAGGAIGNTPLAQISGWMALLALRMLVRADTARSRIGAIFLGGISTLSLGYTITRGAIVGFLLSVGYAVARYKGRLMTIALVVAGLFVVLMATDLGTRLWQRIVGEHGQVRLEESASFRAELWGIYLREPSVHYLLFGRGFTAEFVRHGAVAVHSSYLGAIAYTGLFGLGVLIWVIIRSWQIGSRLGRVDPMPLWRSFGEAVVLCIVLALINGVSSECWQVPQLVLFAFIALADARLRMIGQADLSAPVVDLNKHPGLAYPPPAWMGFGR